MVTINHISFDFTTANEPFARRLYADWDNFCRLCVEQVIEESFSAYDKDKVLREIETLDLDLGNIPENDFFQEFPRRLRNELLKSMPLWEIQSESRKEKSEAARLENLLFYLEHGYPKTEWADSDFSLTEELEWVTSQPDAWLEKIISLCLSKEHVLYRLLWQTNDGAVLLRIYASSLFGHSFSLYEKRRFLGMLLEAKSGIPVRFIHEAKDDTELHDMAELLDSPSVRRIITAESQEHAEVDLPPYWHYLYEWLVRYYPFNGLAIFGGKDEFIRHLHHRLLTFIRKRNHSSYLSKAELTTDFLLEVFGPVYFREVLVAIYDLQPHQADGSPVFDGYFNRELFRIFMHLSLLHFPAATDYPADAPALTAFLKDTRRSSADKRMLLALLAKERPDFFIGWLRTEAIKETALVTTVAEITDDTIIGSLLASVSIATMEAVAEVTAYLRGRVKRTGLLSGIPASSLNLAIRKAVLLWIENSRSVLPELESIRQLLRLIYREITGGDNEDIIEEWTVELYVSGQEGEQSVLKKNSSIKLSIRKVQTVLANKDIPEPVKRRLLALFLEQHRDDYASAILLLHKHVLLEYAIDLISPAAVEEIIRQSAIRMVGANKAADWLPLLDWLVAHEPIVSAYRQDPTVKLKAQLLVWLAKTNQSQAGEERKMVGIAHALLDALFGRENIQTIISRMFRDMISGTGEIEGDDTEAVLSLLLHTEPYISRSVLSDLREWIQQSKNHANTVQMLLESRWNTVEGFTGWLEDTAVSTDLKRELLEKAVAEKPQEWISLLRKLPKASKAVSLVAGYLSVRSILQGMAKTSFHQAAVLSQTVEWLQRRAVDFPFLAVNGIILSIALPQALLLYMQDRDTLGGRTLTEQEAMQKFLSYLYLVYTGKPDYRDNVEWTGLSDRIIAKVSDTARPESAPKKNIRSYLYFQPEELLNYIRSAITQNSISLSEWLEWLDTKDWMQLLASLSLHGAELLQQIMDILSENNRVGEMALRTALATCIIESSTDTWKYTNRNETIRSFVQSLPIIKEKNIEKEMEEDFRRRMMEENRSENPECIYVKNAGLCLFSPWIPRLIKMLDYLNPESCTFKNTESQIRAVFVLQYLTSTEEKNYQESELSFNRMLVSLPADVPLPARLDLTDKEKEIANSLLQSVQANWPKMQHTSLRGLQDSFIARYGRLEKKEEKWLLTIEDKPYDLLLDSLPWSYRLIRLPWLKEYIEVHWHERSNY